MKFAKRTLSLLLSVLLIVSVFAIIPASATVADGDDIAVFFTDSQGFGNVHVYAWDAEGGLTGEWPGAAMTKLYTNGMSQDVYGAIIPATATGVIFNGNGQQTANIESGIANGAWWYSVNNTAVAVDAVTYFAASDSTCSVAGNEAYFKLDNNYYDTTLADTTAEAVAKPLADHTLITHKAVSAKYQVPGNIKYYECSACGKLFSDAEGTQEITLEQTVVPALPFASVGGVAYDNFLDAVAAANGEQIITLNAKVDDPYTLGVDETLIVSDYTKVTVVAPEGKALHRTYTSSPKSYTYTAIEPVASLTVGETVKYYDTMSAALDAAPAITNAAPDASSIVTLLKDSTESSANVGSATAKKAVTIDLGGNSLTLTRNYSGLSIIRCASNVTIKNGTINFNTVNANASGFVVQDGSTLTIEKTVTANATGNTAVVFVVGNSTVNVAGKLNAVNSFAIAGNGSSGKGGYTINVLPNSAVTSTNAPAIYHPNTGSLNITGGKITGATGVYVKSGTTAISGAPTITGNGAAAEYLYDGNGANSTGDALVIDNCGYPGGAPTVTINGGTFVSTNADAIGMYTYGDREPVAPVITAGTFSDDNYDEFITDAVKVKFTAANGRVTYIAELPSAFSSGTYQLLADITRTSRMTPGTFGTDVVLDLNGYTLTSTATDYTILLGRNGTAASPKTFAIVDNSVNGGGKIIGGTNNSVSTAALISVSGTYNYVTIGEGVYVEGGCIALFGEGSKLNVYGTVNGMDDFAIATNGSKSKNITINIHSTATLYSSETAVYLPGYATTTIDDGAYILGATAVYIKGGTTTINGGTFYGVGDAADYTYNGNGANATGDALVLDNCGYPDSPLAITINGGKFYSTYAKPVGSYANEGFDPIGGIITTGEYSAVLDAFLMADGYHCMGVPNADDLYEITNAQCDDPQPVREGDYVICSHCGLLFTGVFDGYYYEEGVVCPDKGLVSYLGDLYYVVYDGRIKIDADRTVAEEKANGLIAPGLYHFDEEGKMVKKNGIVGDYYYVDGVLTCVNGLVQIDGDLYFVTYTGKVKKDANRTVTEAAANGYVPAGTYYFNEDGKLVSKNGIIDGYYYVNNVLQADAGIVEIGDDLYFVTYSGAIKKDADRTVTEAKANGYVPAGTYHFDEDGKMTNRPIQNGIANGYYYENGEICPDAGIVEIDGDFYFVTYSGKIKVDAYRTVVEAKTNGLIPAGTYYFNADGKLVP